jgi:hypothetical protein
MDREATLDAAGAYLAMEAISLTRRQLSGVISGMIARELGRIEASTEVIETSEWSWKNLKQRTQNADFPDAAPIT